MEKTVIVTQTIKVKVDETKFDADFMLHFKTYFYDFDTTEEHIEHLAQLFARGLIGGIGGCGFIEGYGQAKEMGIEIHEESIETEIEDD